MYKRAYVKVDLDRIRKNMKAIRSVLPEGTKIIGVVKADGYGHGAVQTAKAIEEDAAGYAVATAEEALELRGNGIKKPVLVLGPVPECQYGSMVEQEIRTAVFDLTRAERLSETAVSLGMMARVHIAVDTGMNRIGLRPSREQAQVVKEIAGLPGIVTEGMFTHFARADEADKTSAREQLQAFLDFSQMVKEAGVFIPALHCANSAGIMESEGEPYNGGPGRDHPVRPVSVGSGTEGGSFSGTGHGAEKFYYLYKGDRTGSGCELWRDLCGGPPRASGHRQHRLRRRLSQEPFQ